MRISQRFAFLVVALALCLPMSAPAEELALLDAGAAGVRWELQRGDFEKVVLTVSQPDGHVVRREIPGGQPVAFELDAGAKDGVYIYELRGIPRLDAPVRKELAAARKAGAEAAVIQRLRDAGRLPGEAVQSGSFAVHEGSIVAPGVEEPRQRKVEAEASGDGVQVVTAADQVFNDDLIVRGSACVGTDCVNGESFGLDTLRLKEISLQAKFEDTSTSAGFASNDWQLTANDSASGGANKFSIDDVTGAKVPFTITAGAATNSIFVDSTGRVGFRTATPALDLHVNTANTPAIRLEQNSSGGLTAQAWDVAGNENGFFVRDVTGGSRLPLQIRPGAPTSSIDISSSGNVGIGTASPANQLHVQNSGSGSTDGKVLIENTSATASARELLEVQNDSGSALMVFKDSTVVPRWTAGTSTSNFVINNQANAGIEFTFSSTGNFTASGTVSGSSDRNMKKEIVPVRREEILAKLAALPISTWSYKTEDIRHMGPMAQDFAAAFGLGVDDKHIAYTDLVGVTMAAVQALQQQAAAKDSRISELESRVEALEQLVERLAQ